MPWRLVTFVVILGFVVIFAGLNTSNTSNVSFGFFVVENVPIFISLFFAFLVGMIIMVPFVIGNVRKKRPKRGNRPPEPTPDIDLADPMHPENDS